MTNQGDPVNQVSRPLSEVLALLGLPSLSPLLPTSFTSPTYCGIGS